MRAYKEFRWPINQNTDIQGKKDADLLAVRGSGKRPLPPRGLRATFTGLSVNLLWEPAENMVGVVGWRVYRGTESNRIATIYDPLTYHTDSTVPATGSYLFMVSSVNNLGLESLKQQLIVTVT